jgi:uncharacterized protein (UPF0147 family)
LAAILDWIGFMPDGIEKEIENAVEMMRNLSSDNGVPRNIRSAVLEASEKLLQKETDKSVSIGSALYVLEDISNDINMPSHTRTEIWTIISCLESIKEKLNHK